MTSPESGPLLRQTVSECRAGCKPTPPGTYPLDALVTLRQNDSCVSFCMFPLPSRGRDWTPGKGGKDRSRTPFGNKGKGNKGKPGKGKSGKGKKGQSSSQQSPWGSAKKPSMPKELRHLNPQDDKGRRYCYGWNLEEGCDLPSSGNPPECERGLHLCGLGGRAPQLR